MQWPDPPGGTEDHAHGKHQRADGQGATERTGAGMMDCKGALSDTGGDMEQAVDLLRKKGLAKAAKKAGRIAAEGLIGVAIEARKGVVVEVNSGQISSRAMSCFKGS